MERLSPSPETDEAAEDLVAPSVVELEAETELEPDAPPWLELRADAELRPSPAPALRGGVTS